MRHNAARTLSAVLLFFVCLLPAFFLGQTQNSKKPVASASRTKEVVLQADEGPVRKVKGHIRKSRRIPGGESEADDNDKPAEMPAFRVMNHPREDRLRRGRPFHGDVRTLPQISPEKFERPEFEGPKRTPVPFPGAATNSAQTVPGQNALTPNAPVPSAPAPAASNSFEGLDFTNWGAGHPPDTNGDVGPQYYIQTINTSVGIYNKSNGTRVAAFIFNTLMSQGNFGNLCDTANFGDPVVVYDTFEDRWIITDFAFNLSGGNVVAPEFQCFAVSKSGDPVSGGWNFYSVQVAGGFGDYPKFGVWPDGLYMSANVFGFGAGGAFQNVRVWAFNKAQMYAGNATVQVLSFDAPAAEFTLLPSNARLQTGTPPSGSPNYFSVVAQFLNVMSVYKLHADWNDISLSTFSGPFLSLSSTSWSQLLAANQTEQSPGNKLDTLYFRLMVQNQYTNIGGVESLWNSHTVGAAGATSAQAAVRYYQTKVTGGTVEANTSQAFTYSPDATVFRFMPSVAVDRVGNMAIGYSATNATLNPAIRYAGRLFGDPVNSITQTEQSLIEGTGTQSGTCGATCTRWGDYSAMTLDVDGCTFWYTNMYYQTTGLAFNTRVGAFSFPSCTPAATGTLQGTVTDSGTSNPIQGATVALGSRTATTDVNGTYSFTGLPSGTYPSITASFPGYTSLTVASVVVNDGLTTTQNFSLTPSATTGCLTDTTQADFQSGVFTNCDLTSSPGDITLVNAPAINQQNTTLGNNGVGITITTWGGQTFTPSVTGQMTRVDINLFCSGCTGTIPNLTLSLRATSGGLPTGADLASATVTGFNSGAAVFYTATFGTPPTLTAGTQYALVIRPTANPSPGIYALTRSGTPTLGSDVYAGGTRVSGATSGTVWSIPTTGGVTTDAGFKVFIQTGFAASGTFTSSVKDANPSSSLSSTWGTISWTADTPTNTNVQFQVAASNNLAGPFSFVGPDGTASTFFTNGGSLAQFNGFRYLKYQATFSTSDSTVTSMLHDVTICFNDIPITSLAVAPATGNFGGTADLSATLTASGTGVPGKSVDFKLNSNSVGSGITDGSGIATVSAVSLTGINAGSYPGAVTASFAGDSGYLTSSGSAILTVNKADQTITFAELPNMTFGDPDFSVSATATSGLTVTFGASGNCSVTGSTVHLTGAGSCTITASQAGDTNTNAAPDVPRTFSIAKADQTITFSALSGATFGGPDFGVSASTTSGLTVTFGASGNCTVTVSTVHLTGAGSCTITASQAGDANYNPATDVPQSFSIAKADQTITFNALSAATFGDPDFIVNASTNSPLTVTLGASGNCSVTGFTVHITGAGSCTITASQAGDANYNAAPDVPQTFSIAKANQTITFGVLGNKNFGDPDFGVSATATSTLAVTFGASGNCSVTGSTVHITGAGSCTITASQAGDTNYNAATNVPQAFSIAKANQTITFGALGAKNFGDPDFSVSGSASSGLTLTFGASGSCSVTGSTVHLTGAGSCTITASQAGDSNYNAATDVPQTFSIAKANQTITFGALGGKNFGDPDFSVSATASSALGVSFGASGNCSVTGSTVHLTGAGSCTITASQVGDSNFNAATDVPQSFSIGKGSQTITFGALGGKTFGDPDFTVSANASSALTVTFGASGNCSVTGSTVHLTGAGSCTITASQSGDTNWNAATDVPQTFSIAKGSQTITFGALAGKNFGDPDFGVSASTTSPLAVSFGASGNCSVTGFTVHITGAGSCTITASQAGDANYNAAPDVPQSFSIAKANQTITFGALAGKNFGDPDFTVSASTTSPLAVSFGASGNCSVTGSTVHITGAGSCTITASQAGDSNYNAATDVPQTFSIAQASQTITFGTLAGKTFGNPDFSVSATASSGLTASFGASGNCSVSGTTVHITGAGSCTITASQAGNSNFTAATNIPQTFAVAKATPLVTVTCVTPVVYDGATHTCSGSATGIGGVTVTGAQSLTYNGSATAPSAQGVYAVSDGFASSDANYNNASGAGSLTITALVPGVANLSPVLTPQNSAAFTEIINGANFVPGSVMNWNGSARSTTFVSTTQIKASILSTDLAAVGTADITVFNPTPGGGISSAFKFAIDTPAGTPGAVTASTSTSTLNVTHGQSTTLTVTFTGETAGATVTAACFNLPAATTCTLSGNTVTITTSASTPVGSYQVIVVFTVTQQVSAFTGQSRTLFAAGIGFLGLPVALLWMGRGRRKPMHRIVLAFIGLALLLGVLAGCGGHATTPQTHSVTSQSSVAVTLNVN